MTTATGLAISGIREQRTLGPLEGAPDGSGWAPLEERLVVLPHARVPWRSSMRSTPSPTGRRVWQARSSVAAALIRSGTARLCSGCEAAASVASLANLFPGPILHDTTALGYGACCDAVSG
jgi:hypothetical protein